MSFLLYKSYLRIQEQKYIVSIQNEINYYLLNADYNSAFNLLENTESEYQQELDNIIAAYARELCDASYDTLSTSELKKFSEAGGEYANIEEAIEFIESELLSREISAENYIKALSAYEQRDFQTAGEFFKFVIQEDENYENAQIYLDEINKREEGWSDNIYGRNPYVNAAAYDNEYYYVPFVLDGVSGIYKIGSDGTASEFLPVSDSQTEIVISGINIIGDYIYFIAGENVGSGYTFVKPYNIYEMKRDGTGLCLIAEGNFIDMMIKEDKVYVLSRAYGLVEYNSDFEQVKIVSDENVVNFSFSVKGIYYEVQSSMAYNSKNVIYFYDGDESVEIDKKEYLHYYSFGDSYVEQWQSSSSLEKLALNSDGEDTIIASNDIYSFYGKIGDQYLYSVAGYLGSETFVLYDANTSAAATLSVPEGLENCRIVGICYENDAVIIEKSGSVYWSDAAFSNVKQAEEVSISEELVNQSNMSFYIKTDNEIYTDSANEEIICYIENKQTWVYKNNELCIVLEKRYIDEYDCNVYVTHIFTTNYNLLATGNGNTDTVFSSRTYKASYISSEYDSIYAQSSDGYYFSGNSKQGIIIRNSVLVRDYLGTDMLAYFSDGSMKIYTEEDEITGQDLLDEGAVESFSFGPILVENHEVNDESVYIKLGKRNPRSAIGYVEPGHYVMVVCDGRDYTVSRGLNMIQLAQIFEDEGCMLAYNLDGGLTTTVLFMGNYITQRPEQKPGSDQHLHRNIAEIIYAGSSTLSPVDLRKYTYDYEEYLNNLD